MLRHFGISRLVRPKYGRKRLRRSAKVRRACARSLAHSAGEPKRWYLPAAVVHHDYAAVIDKRFLTRHTLWHTRAMLRFLRKHPERLLALR